jgi:hypothetical protein
VDVDQGSWGRGLTGGASRSRARALPRRGRATSSPAPPLGSRSPVWKPAPRALRRCLIGFRLMQRPELRYPLLPQILHERWLRRRSAVEFCRDPTAKKEISTATQRGWQSRQPKASGATRAGKQEAWRRPDDQGRRGECTGQSCHAVSPHLAWIWWCVGERFGDESKSGKARTGFLVGSPASPHRHVFGLGAAPDMRRGRDLTGRPYLGE